jgi:hypothetical protein
LAISSVGTLSEAIAPPVTNTEPYKVPGKISIWFCCTGLEPSVADKMHTICRHNARELWVKTRDRYPSSMCLCEDVDVNHVEDPNPTVAKSLDEAIRSAEVL